MMPDSAVSPRQKVTRIGKAPSAFRREKENVPFAEIVSILWRVNRL